MSPHRLLKYGIVPALAELAAFGIPDSPLARRFLVAIALQESGLRHRRQVTASGAENGPAASFYQGEVTGGMCLTLKHYKTQPIILAICAMYNIPTTAAGLWEAMRWNDIIASVAARLLIYTLPGKLPTTADEAWEQYIDGWRPGKPKRATWNDNWLAADRAVREFQ